MSMMVSFVLSFFPRDVLDEILNLIESVSEDFPSYSYCFCHNDCRLSVVGQIFSRPLKSCIYFEAYKNRWINDLLFYALFNSIAVV